MPRRAMRVRDPIHGTISVSPEEKAVIDSPFFQRLRHVRQLGFGDLAFPGATHTRHVHSLGAMHVASRVFDAVALDAELGEETRRTFRAAVRLAALCHDLGHLPLSHSSEQIAPEVASLGLPAWLARGGARATHEDFTAKLLLDSSLAQLVRRHFGPLGVSPEAAVSLISGKRPPRGVAFEERGVDWTPLLRAIVSGELDADRMDYLLRDSFYTGVNYGRFDLDWIVENLSPAEKEGRVYLALSKAAAFAFEDFLLSRYHMFLSVYYHHTTVSFDYMLKRFYEEAGDEFEIPSDPDRFLYSDDPALFTALRRSKNPWAERIVARRGFKKLVQFTERDVGYDLGRIEEALKEGEIGYFSTQSQGVLSRYFDDAEGPSLYIRDAASGRLTEVVKYTPLYERYKEGLRLTRVYVRPDQLAMAEEQVRKVAGGEVRV